MTHLFNSGRQWAELSHLLPAVFLCSPAGVQGSKTAWVSDLRGICLWVRFIATAPDYLRILFAESADKFRYTCMSGEVTIEGVDDRKDMDETRRTFSLLGKDLHQLSDCNSPSKLCVIFIFPSLLPQGWRRTFSGMCLKFWRPSCTWATWKSETMEATDHPSRWVSASVSLEDCKSSCGSTRELVGSSSVTHTWWPSASCWGWAPRGWHAGCATGGSSW